MKKIRIFILLLLALIITTGCGTLDPKKVNENYVKKQFIKKLDGLYKNVGYTLEITSFNKTSDKREAEGVVRLKDKLNTVCSINGLIEDDCIEYQSCYGTSYHVYEQCDEMILSNIKDILNGKYSFVINDTTNYEKLSNDIKSYITEFYEYLNEYNIKLFSDYSREKYSYGKINITINGNTIEKEIFIDNDNGLVSESQYQDGYIELSEYLKSLAN